MDGSDVMKTIKKVNTSPTPLTDTLIRLNFNNSYKFVVGNLLDFEDDLKRLIDEEIERRSRVATRVVE